MNDLPAPEDSLPLNDKPKPMTLKDYLLTWLRSFCWPSDADQHWYYGGRPKWRVRGYHHFHNLIGFGFCVLCLIPLWHYFFKSGTPPDASATVTWLFSKPELGVAWLICTTVGLPLFVWWENLGFDNWLTNHCTAKTDEKKQMKERFVLNSKYMEGTWKAVAGLYLVGGLLSFSNLGGKNDDAKVQALANATSALLIADKFGDAGPQTPETKEAIEALKKAVKDMTESLAQKPPASGKEVATKAAPPTQQSAPKDGASTQEAQDSAPPVSVPPKEQ